MLLTIDPGVDSGWSLFRDKTLFGCGLGRPSLTEYSGDFVEVIVECSMLRPKGEKNPNAILKMARTAGEHAGFFSHRTTKVSYPTPSEWMGTVTTDILQARIWGRLDEWEKAIVDASFRAAKGRNGLAESKRHNVIDAIGIGLWACRRLGPLRVAV